MNDIINFFQIPQFAFNKGIEIKFEMVWTFII
jgi:hypothetical protein